MDANTPTSKISSDSLSGLVNFGDTDLLVSKYCQGTAFGVLGRSSDNPEGQKVLEYCLDVGVNFFDSSNGYGWGGSEIHLERLSRIEGQKLLFVPKSLHMKCQIRRTGILYLQNTQLNF